MNVITQEKVAGKVLAALKEEGLMNKEAAGIFGFSPSYLSMIIRSDTYHKVTRKAWEAMHDWSQTGNPIKGYKSPLKAVEELTETEQAAREAEAYMKAEEQAMVPEVPASPAPTAEERKQEIAAAFRKDFEQAQRGKADQPESPEPVEETVTVSCKEGKVDLSKLDIRTGVIASAQIQIMEDGSFSLEYHPRR